jgi:hypothetical protein
VVYEFSLQRKLDGLHFGVPAVIVPHDRGVRAGYHTLPIPALPATGPT